MTRLDLLAAAASASVTLIVVPIVRHAGLRAGLTDPPGPLKIHSRPTPRLGGIALFFAMLAGVTVAQRAGLSFLVALLAVWLVGLLDDIVGASASLRLSVQFVAAALLWFDGWRIPIPVATLPVIENALSLVATGLFVVFTINAFNLIDGADGIATGIAASIAGAYILLPLASLGALGFAAAAALFGATTAFLVFNLPPAKIFLGDSGSTLLGLTIAYLGLDFCRALSLSPSSVAFPIIAAAFPILDALLAIVRRVLHGSSLFFGDRSHFYDLLLARGWSPRATVVGCYAINLIFILLAWLTIVPATRPPQLAWLTAATVAAFCTLAIRLGSLRPTPSRSS